jgi:hypothetical protein
MRASQRGQSPHTTVSEQVHRPLDASPHAAALALGRLDPLRPLEDALAALGLGDVVVLQRADTSAPGGPVPDTISAVWPLPGGRHARASWSISVEPVAVGASLLSAAVRVGTDDPADQPRLLDAWPLIGPIVRTHTERMLAAIVELAEDLQEQSATS